MTRMTLVAIGIVSAIAALTAFMMVAREPPPPLGQQIAPDLDALIESSKSGTDGVRSITQMVAAELRSIQGTLNGVAKRPTPIPGGIAGGISSGPIRRSDDQRRYEVAQINQRLGQLTQQVIDLQQRATAIEVTNQGIAQDLRKRIDIAAAATSKSNDWLPIAIGITGVPTSLGTLLLAVRKDSREASEARLRILDLERKLKEVGQPAFAG